MTADRFRVLLIVTVLAFLAGTFALSRTRPLDGDEGYYASAARLVAEGETPYLDFFYPQSPYLPYIYAPWYRVVGNSLAGMRGLSVLAGGLSLLLWGLYLGRCWKDRPWLFWAGLLLVAVNPNFLSWNVTTKTYALTNLAVFAAVWALERARSERSAAAFALLGVAAGLAVGVRALYLPWAAVMVLGALRWAWLKQGNGIGTRHALAVLAGVAAVLAPMAALFLRDPELFWFNNFEYHQLRYSSLSAEGSQLVAALAQLGRAVGSDPYLLVTMLLAGLGFARARQTEDEGERAVLSLCRIGALVYLVTCLFPDPVYPQYFTGPLTPLLAPLSVSGLAWLGERFTVRRTVLAVGALCLVLSAVELGVQRTDMDQSEVWSFAHLARVKEAIEDHSEPDDRVLAFWSGYVFESGRRFVPTMENHFALGVSEQLDLDDKVKYHVGGKEVLLKALIDRYPDVVVLGAWMHEVNTSLEQRHLPLILEELDKNYGLVAVMGETKVLVRKPAEGAGP